MTFPRHILALAVAGTALAGCSPQSAPDTARKGNVPAAPASLVAAVRAAGRNDADALEVAPLRDPQVEDLRQRAARLEAEGRYAEATAVMNQALALTPDDPELLQQAAELALYRQDWAGAERLANASYEKGPKLGPLCRRNWTAVHLARQARGDEAGAQAVASRIKRCTVEPPVRM